MKELIEWLADWFDNPKNPAVVVTLKGERFTAGYLLRCIADQM